MRTLIDLKSKILLNLGMIIGLAAILLSAAACGNVIEIVPLVSPTPVEVSQASTQSVSVDLPGIPNRIMVQAIGLNAPVIEMGWRLVEQGGETVSEWEMPDDEAAWHRNSAVPGMGSNVVISGHNASTGGRVFAELDRLQVGDEIKLWNDKDEVNSYHVVEKNIVRTFFGSEEAQNYLQTVTQPTLEERLTLISCWPRWSNTHRLIVIAEPR